MIRVAICDDDIVFTTRVEELILDFGRAYSFEICIYLMDILCWNPCGRETVLILFLWI